MKDKLLKWLKFLLVMGLTILWCYAMLMLFDSVLNGWIKDTFYNLFIYTSDFTENNVEYHYEGIRWGMVRIALMGGFVFASIAAVIIVSLMSARASRKRMRKDLAIFTEALASYNEDHNNVIKLPREFAQAETELTRLKADAAAHEQMLLAETQRKNDLITYLAHDLKTPLASVIGYLSLLDETPDLPAELKAKYTGVALDKAFRLEQLINEFFDITRFNLQQIVVNKERIPLAFMLEQMSDEFYPMLSEGNKNAVVSVPEDLVLIGDADKLARVFNNILKNAVAYSAPGSDIIIKARRLVETMAEITFTNFGNPIPGHKLETIFEKFYRLDNSRSTATGGAGLGLAIAREIVQAHGGTIGARSDLNETVFTVVLPVERST